MQGAKSCAFIVTTDGAVGERGKELIQLLAKGIAAKWKISLSRAVTYIRTRIAVALAKGCSACILSPHYRRGPGLGGPGAAFAWRNPGPGHEAAGARSTRTHATAAAAGGSAAAAAGGGR